MKKMICKACGEEPLPVDKNVTFLKQEELIKDQQEADKQGVCLRCYWGQRK